MATSALGMGYDKADLAFCIHVGCPSSPVAKYQQVGRAGRAMEDAVGRPAPGRDRRAALWGYFATASMPDPDHAAAVLAVLDEGPSTVPIEAATGIRRGRLESLLKIMAVDGATARAEAGWIATGAGWSFDARASTMPWSRRAPPRPSSWEPMRRVRAV